MHPLIALLLGGIEGFTEFLPISSTAHLLLAARLLQMQETEFVKTFQIVIQLGAILAAVVFYGRTLVLDRKVLTRVAVAFVPTAVLGFVLHDIVKRYLFEDLHTVLWAMLIGGVLLLLFEWLHKGEPTDSTAIGAMSLKQAFGVGVCQAVALVPGVSRSAATIVGGQMLGIDRKTIVDFSFLLAIPTMIAATGLDLVKARGAFHSGDMLALGIGFVVSFLVALACIRWFLRFIKTNSFAVFGWYRIIVGILGLLFLL